MKEIKVGDKTISLDVGDELRVKDLRKIAPFITNIKQGEEMTMIINIVEALGGKEEAEKVDEMSVAEFTEFSKHITDLLDVEKKTKKL